MSEARSFSRKIEKFRKLTKKYKRLSKVFSD
jgi:hypothetical protein